MMLGFRVFWMISSALFGVLVVVTLTLNHVEAAQPHRILVDTDVDTDDVLALLYLLKQNRTEFDLQAITINSNGWSDAGHAVNYVYDILSMMDRDDIAVGVGGEGGILPNGTFLPNVGGYHPIIDQGTSTAGGCRYRQAIPPGKYGRLYVNTNYGIRKALLPQGGRKYVPVEQASAQQVMKDAISAGSISVFVLGTHTNLAIFLMTYPRLKKNIEHIYVMGGAIEPLIGNLFPQDSNPYAEFNFFGDPFAAYTVLHSGVPVTLIPLDATRTIPVNEDFFSAFEQKQDTFEAHYSFQTLKMVHDTWPNNQFHKDYCFWDSFMVGVALSQMRNLERSDQGHAGENEFAEMEYMNISVITSNTPYGTSDGSNPLVGRRSIPKFNVQKNGVHSGHVQLGMQDPFCIVKGSKGKCQDGYTKKATGRETVRLLVATEAKPNRDIDKNMLTKEFYKSFLDVINRPNQQNAQFSNTRAAQFSPYEYERVVRRQQPEFGKKSMGKPVVFDMDMSAGDFLALLYLLKLPVELINLRGILVSPNGWATAASIEIVYDLLHMTGHDDIQVGLGNVFAVGQSYSSVTFSSLGDCSYSKSIPHGSGGSLDSDTLFGFARDLPRSPRRYKPEISGSPGFGQPTALDVWKSIVKSLHPGSKITLLANGPLTNLAEILLSENNTDSVVQEVYIVGGHIGHKNENAKGNVFTVPSNEYAEFNMFLDPWAAKAVFDSTLNITLIPLGIQKQVGSFENILNTLQLQLTDSHRRTPEAVFSHNLISKLWQLKQNHHSYHHMDTFLGEILGAVTLAGNGTQSQLNQTFKFMPLKVVAEGDESVIGQMLIDCQKQAKMVKILCSVNQNAFYEQFANVLGQFH